MRRGRVPIVDMRRSGISKADWKAVEMKPERIFPTILIILDVCAAIGYTPSGNWRRVAAAILTYVITY